MRFIPSGLSGGYFRLAFRAFSITLVYVALCSAAATATGGELQQQRADYQRAQKLLREGKLKQF